MLTKPRFENAKRHYLRERKPPKNIISILNGPLAILDGIILENVGKELPKVIKKWQTTETRKGSLPSEATIQSWIRYTKAICSLSDVTLPKSIKVGKAVRRCRSLKDEEIQALRVATIEYYPWFYFALDFALKNPIRPEDQFNLTGDCVQKIPTLSISYPNKKTGRTAYPITWPEHVGFLEAAEPGKLLFNGSFTVKSLFHNNRYYVIFKRICRLAGVRDATWYDLRHHAVAYCRSVGVEDWRIQKIPGWASMAMLNHYDPDNQHLIHNYDKLLMEKNDEKSRILASQE